MRRVVICIILLSVLLLGCSKTVPDTWQTVLFENINCKISVPGEWELVEIDGIRYFTNGKDNDDRIYYMFEWFNEYYNDSNLLCSSLSFNEVISGELLSIGVFYGEGTVEIDDKIDVVKFIEFPFEAGARCFYVWDNNVDYDTLEKIAHSFDFINY